MAEYKNLLSGYVNDNKKGDGQHLAITNVSEMDIVIKAGEKVFLNKTPQERLDQYPKIPHFSKSIKIEDQQEEEEDVSESIPF